MKIYAKNSLKDAAEAISLGKECLEVGFVAGGEQGHATARHDGAESDPVG